jgi:hypothetical protein
MIFKQALRHLAETLANRTAPVVGCFQQFRNGIGGAWKGNIFMRVVSRQTCWLHVLGATASIAESAMKPHPKGFAAGI